MSETMVPRPDQQRGEATLRGYADELPARLRAARQRRKISQRMLANELGVTPGLVAQWELGMCRPSPDNRLDLSALLDVPLRDLYADLLPDNNGRGPWLIDDPDLFEFVRLLQAMSPEIREALRTVAMRLAAQPVAATEPAASADTAPADRPEPPETARFG
jgi:transcriptional regulator with XRE-family HTH domain